MRHCHPLLRYQSFYDLLHDACTALLGRPQPPLEDPGDSVFCCRVLQEIVQNLALDLCALVNALHRCGTRMHVVCRNARRGKSSTYESSCGRKTAWPWCGKPGKPCIRRTQLELR